MKTQMKQTKDNNIIHKQAIDCEKTFAKHMLLPKVHRGLLKEQGKPAEVAKDLDGRI